MTLIFAVITEAVWWLNWSVAVAIAVDPTNCWAIHLRLSPAHFGACYVGLSQIVLKSCPDINKFCFRISIIVHVRNESEISGEMIVYTVHIMYKYNIISHYVINLYSFMYIKCFFLL